MMDKLKIDIGKIPATVSAVDVARVLAAAGLKLGKPVPGTGLGQLTLDRMPEGGSGLGDLKSAGGVQS